MHIEFDFVVWGIDFINYRKKVEISYISKWEYEIQIQVIIEF